MTKPASYKELLKCLLDSASMLNAKLFLVGGVVRDVLLGSKNLEQDIDLVIDANAIEFARKVHPVLGGSLAEFSDFFTAKVTRPERFPDIEEIDLASARREIYLRPGALPEVELASIEMDLKRRDFSINALALPIEAWLAWSESGSDIQTLRPSIIDRFDGLSDLDSRRIKVLHSKSFSDDPTRLFRAIRYMTRLNGVMTSETEELFRQAIDQQALQTVSAARQISEIKKICRELRAGEMLDNIVQFGIWGSWTLLPGEISSSIIVRIKQSEELFDNLEADLKFELFLLSSYVDLAEAKRETTLNKLGLGRKKFRIYAEASEPVPKTELNTCSNLRLIWNYLSAQTPELGAEISRRGLNLRRR